MLTVNELYDLSHSLAGDYLKQFTYPWEALAGISDLILEIGKQLPEDEYVHPTDWDGNVLEDVWVAKDATVLRPPISTAPASSATGRRSVSAPLSGAAHWLAMTAWWATPRS